MKYDPQFTNYPELFNNPIHVRVTCRGCGRVTTIRTDNALGIILKCPKCGASGFKRDVIQNGT
jgi:predicted nucleic-acid-binding Zn-ribbon protein